MKLKPCPFCGGKAVMGVRVVCTNCTAIMTDCFNARGKGKNMREDYTELSPEEVADRNPVGLLMSKSLFHPFEFLKTVCGSFQADISFIRRDLIHMEDFFHCRPPLSLCSSL